MSTHNISMSSTCCCDVRCVAAATIDYWSMIVSIQLRGDSQHHRSPSCTCVVGLTCVVQAMVVDKPCHWWHQIDEEDGKHETRSDGRSPRSLTRPEHTSCCQASRNDFRARQQMRMQAIHAAHDRVGGACWANFHILIF